MELTLLLNLNYISILTVALMDIVMMNRLQPKIYSMAGDTALLPGAPNIFLPFS